jgi:hypothetical protein
VSGAYVRQIMSGLETEVLDQLDDRGIHLVDRILLVD